MKVLAIDHGEKYMGFAISDDFGSFAAPLKVAEVTQNNSDVSLAIKVVNDEKPEIILVGLPTGLGFKPTQRSKRVMAFCDKLNQATGIEVKTWDETGSTIAAVALGKRSRSKRQDSEAARIILQEYLDFQHTHI